MNEMEDLRQVAGYLVDIDEGYYARRVDKALRAWEADIARIEVLLEHRRVFGCGGVWGCAVCDRLIADLREAQHE